MSVGADRLRHVAGYAVGLVRCHAHFRPGSADDEALAELAEIVSSPLFPCVAVFASKLNDEIRYAAESGEVTFEGLAPLVLKQMGILK